MLCLTKKTEYALIALASLGQRTGEVSSARDIALEHDLPPALLMNILKALQQKNVLCSTRGARGGYTLGSGVEALSLYDLILVLEGRVQTTGCEDHHEHVEHDESMPHAAIRAIEAPVRALQFRLTRFLKDVRVTDLIMPGRRIDVPAELVGLRRLRKSKVVKASEGVTERETSVLN